MALSSPQPATRLDQRTVDRNGCEGGRWTCAQGAENMRHAYA